MHASLIYGGVMGAILASMPAIETHVVAFNHEEVVDLTELCTDPVDLLFGVQLSGAEDYWKATCYCERFMHTPAKTLYIVIGDLYDTSPNENRFVKKMIFCSKAASTRSPCWPSLTKANRRSTRTSPTSFRRWAAVLCMHPRSLAGSPRRRPERPRPSQIRRTTQAGKEEVDHQDKARTFECLHGHLIRCLVGQAVQGEMTTRSEPRSAVPW